MANGTIIQSQAVWRGEVTIGGIRAHGEFEVFQSSGGWKFLLRKPLLQAFKVVHDYESDEVQVSGIGGTATLYNQAPKNSAVNIEERGGVHTDGDPIPEEELDSLLEEIPTDFLTDDNAIFTRLTQPHNPKWVVWIVKQVQYGPDLSMEE
ncbi:hypothetical protein EDB19DRAFT_1833266 [Suillus lakei]|nr:hypothetical protein EDB19DRAFT_1833266 [Suillus lakei]